MLIMLEFIASVIDVKIVAMSILGGCAYILFWKITDKYEIARHLGLAFIAGIVYSILHSDYNFPNAIMGFVVGWFAPDFLQSLVERWKEKRR